MGWFDSLPVISQAKSLVQVATGDVRGARETQRNFAKVANDVGNVVYEVAQETPVIGQSIAAGHAIAGNNAEAERIALASTKNTVVALAGAAGAACGPGAAACGAAFAISSSHGWDAAESGIRGEKVGSIKGWDNLVNGKADLNEGIDLMGGIVLDGAGGAMGAGGLTSGVKKRALKSGVKSGALKSGIKSRALKSGIKSKALKSGIKSRAIKSGTKSRIKSRAVKSGTNSRTSRRSSFQRCKRSVITDENLIYDANLNDIPENLIHRLPGSVTNITLAEDMAPASLVDSALSLIFVLKLMSIGHIKSKIYYGEMCSGLYPHLKIEECSVMLHNALNKFAFGKDVSVEDFDSASKQNKTILLADLLDGLQFEIKSLSKNTLIGHFLEVAACKIADLENVRCIQFVTQLKDGLREIDGFVNLADTKRRVKRCLPCGHACNNDGSKKFKRRHAQGQTKNRGASLPNHNNVSNTIYTQQNWLDAFQNKPTRVLQQVYNDGKPTGTVYTKVVIMKPVWKNGKIVHVNHVKPSKNMG